jgi:hypothetical protein
LGGFGRLRAAVCDQPIETLAMGVEQLSVIARFDCHRQSASELRVEINQVRIQIIEDRPFRSQTKRNCQPATKWFDVTTALVPAP